MRLIDADEFIKSIPDFELPTDTIDACTLRILLRNAPTVDPVKHGHWFLKDPDDGYSVFCSVCKDYFVLPQPMHDCNPIDDMNLKYCPNCGAKMDEVSE